MGYYSYIYPIIKYKKFMTSALRITKKITANRKRQIKRDDMRTCTTHLLNTNDLITALPSIINKWERVELVKEKTGTRLIIPFFC